MEAQITLVGVKLMKVAYQSIEIVLIVESVPRGGTGFKHLFAKVLEGQTEIESRGSNTAS